MVKQVISKVPGIADITVVRELGQPSLTITPDRAKIARYGLNVDDVNTLVETADGRQGRHAGDSGRAPVRPCWCACRSLSAAMDAIRNLLIATPDGQHLPLSQFADIRVSQRRIVHLPRVELALSSACSSASRIAIWRARWTRRAARWSRQVDCPSATRSIGAANTRTIWRRAIR